VLLAHQMAKGSAPGSCGGAYAERGHACAALGVQSRNVGVRARTLQRQRDGRSSSRLRHPTPRVRADRQAAHTSTRSLARPYGLDPKTVAKQRKRTTTADAPMGPGRRDTVLPWGVRAFPCAIRAVLTLTDPGTPFANRPRCRGGPTAEYAGHPSNRVCQAHRITRTLARPYHPWPNGPAERLQPVEDAGLLCDQGGSLAHAPAQRRHRVARRVRRATHAGHGCPRPWPVPPDGPSPLSGLGRLQSVVPPRERAQAPTRGGERVLKLGVGAHRRVHEAVALDDAGCGFGRRWVGTGQAGWGDLLMRAAARGARAAGGSRGLRAPGAA
jgi:hypothetical protein